ncbi:hypothetical protein AU255_15410 [Methyloprofundus sedimenti]|uniref:Flavohemoglobin expression-modulating QEGLA motif protein n=1 Tax=Methyloprofundus sedimenti TaxID=1420851 RepID=A0A1V8M223_9GAMM|nr:flavohemoglobin expression-modulating QEGLA motif protein [Methyloprofundus sedimenti]OQK15609.1 hypothetical protein AU255_15410 [Methyloprofundus sedimenti]
MSEPDYSTTLPFSQSVFMQNLDNSLHALVSGIDILEAVSPLNYLEQKQNFFEGLYSIEPKFLYRENLINSYKLKRDLFNLPLDEIQDEDLARLYLDVVDSYVDKIDQFKSIGSSEFLYDSLRYYGEPSVKDLRNAHFILHLPEEPETDNCQLMDVRYIESVLKAFADKEGYDYELILNSSMIANALVSGLKIKINSSAQVSEIEAQALAHHELGVHLLTTLNARSQPLKILSLGCPVNTMTQEGLAILSEYLAGCMTIKRLKILALRVLAVESMIKEKNFRTTFLFLKEQHHIDDNQAFTITARVYRGGGFTKDYLYLQGFHQVLNAYEQAPDFNNLLTGKVSLDYLGMITRLIEKGILIAPIRLTPSFLNPVSNDDIQKFVTHAIK